LEDFKALVLQAVSDMDPTISQQTLTFRVANVGKTQLSWRDGTWLGRDPESDMHFVADSSGVFKTRNVRRNILSRQSSFELLQSITATPWDPTGSKSETDAFILPLSKDDPQPLSEGASKEDLAAEEPLDDYIEPESPLPDDLVDLLVEGSATFFAITCSQA
jgi:hypothetical protein